MKQNKRKMITQKLVMIIGICSVMTIAMSCGSQNELSYQTEDEKEISGFEDFEVKEAEAERDGMIVNEQNTKKSTGSTKVCYVYVCGEVKQPGVYKFPEESRVFEAIEAAGGYTSIAAENYINQAEMIVDGMKLVVPSKEELSVLEEKNNQENSNLVDINKAEKEKLMTLPGIGEGRAEAIMKYREENGAFQSPEDLLKVDGIKQGIFDKLKAFVIVT